MELESENTQEVAELEGEVDETTEVETVEGNLETEPEVKTEENPVQDEATRRMYAETRRQKERLEKENKRMVDALKNFEFEGETPDEIADHAEAFYKKKDVEDVRRERETREAKEQEEALLKYELEELRLEKTKSAMERDLKDIQKIDPSVKDLDSLGERYFALIKSGVTGIDAFNAIRASDALTKKTPPKEIGKVGATSKADKTFYTSQEVDAMIASGSKELDNPKVLSLIEKSMTKWGK